MANDHFLTDVNVYKPNKALAAILSGVEGNLEGFLLVQGAKFVAAYQARVAKRTGRLAESAVAHVVANGGHKHDRLVGKVTVGGETVRNPRGGFEYTLLHEFGDKDKEHPAAKDLRAIAREMWGTT
ncbi:hypothetical protein [Mycobacteroides abscessus]|uniref:hypothetical protein n=1 Tax=Mycobacteroides abscessus TaxID=36809 RepID=UPI000D3E96C5|nr:hypothetical protein [Mycobacteroides abscessus]PVB19736.1 hypothetical protein DDJ40_08230 [Mycobacteroides abscessus]RIU40339.1 hypothetical protein D2E83_11245 [Mycobacteroides abscessus]